MNIKEKKKKDNYGVKKITMKYYLNSYFNPNFESEITRFYGYYFDHCSHLQLLTKLNELKKEVYLEKKNRIKIKDLELYQKESYEKLEIFIDYLQREEISFYKTEEYALNMKTYTRLMVKNYLEELEHLCEGVIPVLNKKEVKQCDVLTGRILCVKDDYNKAEYYAYHSSLFPDESLSFYEKEHKLTKKIFKTIDKEKIKY